MISTNVNNVNNDDQSRNIYAQYYDASIINELYKIHKDTGAFFDKTMRIINCGDAENTERLDWIRRAVSKFQLYNFNLAPDILVSTANEDFDLIIFSGEDTQRIVNFLKSNSAMLLNKAKICLCVKSDPKRRAKLLTAGFDDVVEISRTTHIEFFSRMITILSRYWNNTDNRMKQYHADSALERFAYLDQLKPRLRILLEKMIDAPDWSVTTFALRSSVSSNQETITLDHLKVLISSLRKTLKPGVGIIHYNDSMYKLSIKE